MVAHPGNYYRLNIPSDEKCDDFLSPHFCMTNIKKIPTSKPKKQTNKRTQKTTGKDLAGFILP